MAQYYYKTENSKIILYICEFDWNDIYKIVAPTNRVDVKLLTSYTLSEKTEENPQQFWDGLVYMDEKYVHSVFEEVKKGQPLSAVRELLERLKLNVYEYDISVNGINIYSYYHDDAIIEIPDGKETDEVINHIFRCLNLEENLLDELKRKQKKILTVHQGKITATSEEIEDYFDYLNDQYYVKYPECFVPGRVF